MAPLTIRDNVVDLFLEGKLSGAVTYLGSVVRALERGVRSEDRWRYSRNLVDAYIRLGFISALLGRRDDAADAFGRAHELDQEGEGLFTLDTILSRTTWPTSEA